MRKICFVVILAGLITLLFWPYFSHGKLPVAVDIPVGMYYPWLNYSYGYPVRPPVKNPLLTDTVSQFWIWRNWAVEGLKSGQIKLWNPFSFSGYPVSPWFHTILLSPLNFFYFLVNAPNAISLIIISQIFISLVGSYLLGQKLFKSFLPALGLALTWSLSSYFVGWLTWGTVSFGLSLLPWALFFSPNSKVFPFILALIIFSGHPQTILYLFLLIFLWQIFNRQNLKHFFISLIFSLGIASIVLIPSLKIIADSTRLGDDAIVASNYGFIPPAKILLTLITPNFFGNPGTHNYWGGDYNFQEKLISFGIIPLFLAIYQIVLIIKTKKANPLQLFAFSSLLLGFLLTTKYPLGFLVYFFKIPLLSTSPAGRSFVIAIFGGSLLAGITLHHWLAAKTNPKVLFWSIFISLVLVLLPIILVFISIRWLTNLSVDTTNLNISLRNLLFSLAILFPAVVLSLISHFSSHFRKISLFFLLFLIFFDAFNFFKKYTPFVDPNLYFPVTPAIEFLQQKSKNEFFRLDRESAELLPPNTWQIFGLYSVSGYDPINPKSYTDYLINQGVRAGYSRYLENGNDGLDKLNQLGIKYRLVLKRDKEKKPSPAGFLPEWIDPKIWKVVFEEGTVAVLEKINFIPPYWLETSSSQSNLKLVTKTDNNWLFQTNSSSDNRLILMENFTSDWSAKIDNQKVKIEPYLQTFKSVIVPPGNHQVEFVYHNRGWQIGTIISLLSLVGLFLLVK